MDTGERGLVLRRCVWPLRHVRCWLPRVGWSVRNSVEEWLGTRCVCVCVSCEDATKVDRFVSHSQQGKKMLYKISLFIQI